MSDTAGPPRNSSLGGTWLDRGARLRRRLRIHDWPLGPTFSTRSRIGIAAPADVLISVPIPFIKALKQETTTIPIVMTGTPEPVRTGIITNLARPEGNVTGVSLFSFDITSKRIELLKEIVPH